MNTFPKSTREQPYNYRTAGDNDPLYVVNKTGSQSGRAAGPVVIQVTTDGDTRVVTVENTWVPQDLSNQALPTAITRTMDFRTLVNRGIIEVMEPGKAEEMLRTPRAQNEMDRLAEVKNGRGRGGAHSLDGGALVADAERLAAAAEQAREANAGRLRPSNLLNPGVNDREPETARHTGAVGQVAGSALPPNLGVEIIDRYNRNQTSLEDAVAAMAGVASLLSPEEKSRLKQVQNLPRPLQDAVAAL